MYWKSFLSCYVTSERTDRKHLLFSYPWKCLLIVCTPYSRKRRLVMGWFPRIYLQAKVIADAFPSNVSTGNNILTKRTKQTPWFQSASEPWRNILTVSKIPLYLYNFSKFSKAANILEISTRYSLFLQPHLATWGWTSSFQCYNLTPDSNRKTVLTYNLQEIFSKNFP
jgi:hypothetical protein